MEIKGLSVCIPTYGRRKYLYTTINWILELLEEGDEIVIVDQNRTPILFLEEFKNLIHGFKINYIYQKEPNLCKARNVAALAARNFHILFVDDDVKPNLELLTHYKQALKHYDIVGGEVYIPIPSDFDNNTLTKVISNNVPYIKEFTKYSTVVGCNFAFKKDTFYALNGFDENFKGRTIFDETDFMRRAVQKGFSVHFEPKAWVIHFRVSEGGIRSKTPELYNFLSHFIYFYRFPKYIPNKIKFFIGLLKSGPLRKQNQKKPYRIPFAILLFACAFYLGWRKSKKVNGFCLTPC